MKIRMIVIAVALATVGNQAFADIICDPPGCITNSNGTAVGFNAGQSTGTLTVTSPSTLDTPGIGIGGSTHTGTATVDGGTVNAAYSLFLGLNDGTGIATAQNGGKIGIGVNPTNSKTVAAVIGDGGVGTLSLQTGGQLSVTNARVGGDSSILVGYAGNSLDGSTVLGAGTGAATVDGTGSLLSVRADDLAAIVLGESDGASTLSGIGTLNVTGGGVANISAGSASPDSLALVRLGSYANALGVVNVSGIGSQINVTANGGGAFMLVGSDTSTSLGVGAGTGIASITDHGQVNVFSATPNQSGVAVGYGLGNGIMTVATGGQLNAGGGVAISQNDPISGHDQQTGTLIVNDTGIVVAPVIFVGNGGNLDGTPVTGVNGTLAGTGTVVGTVYDRNGGLIAPGNSPGTLTIHGDLFADGGSIEIQLAGLGIGQFDQLIVTGTADLTNANVLFSFIDGFLPSADDMVNFIVADAIKGFEFAHYSYEGAAPGFEFHVTAGGGGLQFVALNDARSVPEPDTLALIGGGVLALGFARLRRKRAA